MRYTIGLIVNNMEDYIFCVKVRKDMMSRVLIIMQKKLRRIEVLLVLVSILIVSCGKDNITSEEKTSRVNYTDYRYDSALIERYPEWFEKGHFKIYDINNNDDFFTLYEKNNPPRDLVDQIETNALFYDAMMRFSKYYWYIWGQGNIKEAVDYLRKYSVILDEFCKREDAVDICYDYYKVDNISIDSKDTTYYLMIICRYVMSTNDAFEMLSEDERNSIIKSEKAMCKKFDDNESIGGINTQFGFFNSIQENNSNDWIEFIDAYYGSNDWRKD